MPSAELATLIKKSLTPRLDQFTERVNKQLVLAAHDMIGNLKPGEHKDIPHVYMLTQHMVAKASASVFVGETLADDPYLIDSFKNMVIEVAKTRNTPRPWLEPFEKGQAFYQWWIGKTSPVVKRHRAQLHNAVAPTVHERVARAKAEGDAYQRPDDLLQDVIDMYPTRKRRIDLMRFVVDMLTLLIFAALHTTSENSTLVIYRLLQHPEVMDALVEEQEAVLQEEGLPKDAPSTMLTRKMIKKLDKLDSACRESFRLKNDYLALPHLYTGKKPLTLSNGAVIKPGERAIINSWMNHTSSGTPASATHGYDSWDPYRFFGKDKQATKISEDYLFFGLGKHACPGRFFAIQEVKVLISALLREYKLSAPSGVVFPTNDTIRLPQGVLRIEKR
ncbi:cytochrome P450 [Syncephalastrum racemosum]|uniref:Cytochrome P450 n=1 Tax=Syncephalastrum racemosum TaxID=13706 RepID=A0A1X2HH37_SYNRA|nr:cytochrome P450 [Syncephalastrum racemosum]